MERSLESVPIEVPGLACKLNRDCYLTVEAVDFAITHDDGRAVEDIGTSDIVLVGPSRVGKTPLLAQLGWKTANIPVCRPAYRCRRSSIGYVSSCSVQSFPRTS